MTSENAHPDPEANPVDEDQKVPATEQLEKLSVDAQKYLARLDELGKNLKRMGGPAPGPPSSKVTPLKFEPNTDALADVEARIEFAKLSSQRQQADLKESKNRFNEIQTSIKKREEHVNNMLGCLNEIDDD